MSRLLVWWPAAHAESSSGSKILCKMSALTQSRLRRICRPHNWGSRARASSDPYCTWQWRLPGGRAAVCRTAYQIWSACNAATILQVPANDAWSVQQHTACLLFDGANAGLGSEPGSGQTAGVAQGLSKLCLHSHSSVICACEPEVRLGCRQTERSPHSTYVERLRSRLGSDVWGAELLNRRMPSTIWVSACAEMLAGKV